MPFKENIEETQSKSLITEGTNRNDILSKVAIVPTITFGRTYIVANRLQLDFFYSFGWQLNTPEALPSNKVYINIGLSTNILAF
jgi:hypothetical protein